MAAKIAVPASYNLPAIAESAGNDDAEARSYSGGFLTVQGVTQEALESALAAYDHLAFLKTQKRATLKQQAHTALYASRDTDEVLDILTEVAYKARTDTDLGLVTTGQISGYVTDIQAIRAATVTALQAVTDATTEAELAAVQLVLP